MAESKCPNGHPDDGQAHDFGYAYDQATERAFVYCRRCGEMRLLRHPQDELGPAEG